MANVTYNQGKHLLLSGAIDLANDTIKVMLVDDSYVPNADDDFAAVPAADEISVTNYEAGFAGAGRKTLASKVFAVDDSVDLGTFSAANLTWTELGAGGTIKWAVIYKHDTSDAASPLICALDVHATGLPTNGGDVALNFNNGIVLQAS
jgi:hypothetical protein